MADVTSDVAEQIRRLMEEQGLSQRRLATLAGVSPNTVLAATKGENLQPGKLRAILDALGVPPPSRMVELPGVPDDVRVFVEVSARRLSRMDVPVRTSLMKDFYERILREGDRA